MTAKGLNRLGVAFFFDEHGVVDEYMFYLIQKLMPFMGRMVFVVNGTISADSIKRLEDLGCEVILRPNDGFDVAAYKHGIEHVGFDKIAEFDELILFNHTFYGPIFPFSEMFEAMDARTCDFWGITSHKEMIPNPFTGEGILPRHINSHYIAVRKNLLQSPHFVRYWREMPHIKSYLDSIFVHESRFTQHFEDLGFVSSVYNDDRAYDSHYPNFINIDETIKDRCPILKRRPFFHEYLFHEEYAIDLPRAVRLIEQNSDYPAELIWPNIIRSSKLRTLNTTAALTSIFPDKRLRDSDAPPTVGRIAVCMHIYYTDMTADMLRMAENIPGKFDFIATTHTEENAAFIREVASKSPKVDQVIVRVVAQNRGRDMSSLFITCRDLFLDDRYALVCRLHSKKSPQVDVARSQLFKRHMEENLLNSPGYVSNVIDMFEEKPWVGLAIPPIIHISYPTMGQSWFNNRPKATKVAKELGLQVSFDDDTPVAAYGTMFWFRPKALRKLFERDWKWEEFNAEPHHVDGGLAHVLERLIAYTAQDAGYLTQHILCPHLAAQNYVSLEYKAQKVGACVGGTFRWQYDQLNAWVAAGRPVLLHDRNRKAGETKWKAAWSKVEHTHFSGKSDEKAAATTRPREQGKLEGLIKKLWTGTRVSYSAWLHAWLSTFGVSKYSGLHGFRPNNLPQAHRIFPPVKPGSLLPFFDPDYYAGKYPDYAKSGLSPFQHFMEKGWRARFNPHPLFDTADYLARDSMIETIGMNPLEHYIRHGSTEGRSTHIAFDVAFYTEMNPEVETGYFDPLAHYIERGATDQRDPHPLFDIAYYLSQRPDIARHRLDPLSHYLEVGGFEGLNPHPLFDSRYYLDRNPEVAQAGMNPLVHFLKHGAEELRNPHPLFDTAYYAKQNAAALATVSNPLVHFVRSGIVEMRNPNALFDSGFYAKHNPALVASGLPPFMHYLLFGRSAGRDPHPAFRSRYYLDQHADAAASSETPLAFYFRTGKSRGDKTQPES